MVATAGNVAPTAMTVFGVTVDASGNVFRGGLWVDMFRQYPSSVEKSAVLSRVGLRRKIWDGQKKQGMYNIIPKAR